MGSILNPQPGDWLQHEAFLWPSSRGRQAKLAEVVQVSSSEVRIYLLDNPGHHAITHAEVTRWWDIFKPPLVEEPPSIIQSGDEFTTSLGGKNYRAVIRGVRDTWISFVEECNDFSDVFRLMPYRDFVTAGWTASQGRSVWDWLRHPLV